MTKSLLASSRESDLAYLLGSPAQRSTGALIASLVSDLRTMEDRDLFEFQGELVGAVADAEERHADASRNVKRLAARKSAPESPGPSWDVERILYDRIIRQLRTVGDALAWRLFGFDRRIIIALSQNAPPGRMTGKAGLDQELRAVVHYHETDGTFALLHSITNCLRIADLTVFEPDMPKIQEIKTTASRTGSRQRAQRQRAQRAIDVINNGGTLGEEGASELFVASAALKTRISNLREILDAGRHETTVSAAIGDQHVITIVNGLAIEAEAGDLIDVAERKKQRAFVKARLDKSEHLLAGQSFDQAGRDPKLAPATIFPLPPDDIARLTIDLVSYRVTIGWQRLAQAFERRGLTVTSPLQPRGGDLEPGQAILLASEGDRTLTIHDGGIGQLLVELVDIDRYATAVTEYIRRERTEGRPSSAVLTFANERAIWR